MAVSLPMPRDSLIEQMPDEILFSILLLLDIPELHALSQVPPSPAPQPLND